MKKVVFVLLALLMSVSVDAQNVKTKYNVDDSKIALQGYSPVSYIELGIAQKGIKQHKSTYEDVNYYFTSAEQKKMFDNNPKKYLPAYGGYCAFGIAVGAKFRIDPNKFIVKNGKCYLFLYNIEVDAQQLWVDGNHNELVAKANKNWESLKQK